MQVVGKKKYLNLPVMLVSTMFGIGFLNSIVRNIIITIIAFVIYNFLFMSVMMHIENGFVEAIIKTGEGYFVAVFLSITCFYFYLQKPENISRIILDKFLGLVLMFSITSPFVLLYSLENDTVWLVDVFFVLILPITCFFLCQKYETSLSDFVTKKMPLYLKVMLDDLINVLIASVFYHAVLLFYIDMVSK